MQLGSEPALVTRVCPSDAIISEIRLASLFLIDHIEINGSRERIAALLKAQRSALTAFCPIGGGFSRKEVLQWNLSVLAVEVALPSGCRRAAGLGSHIPIGNLRVPIRLPMGPC